MGGSAPSIHTGIRRGGCPYEERGWRLGDKDRRDARDAENRIQQRAIFAAQPVDLRALPGDLCTLA